MWNENVVLSKIENYLFIIEAKLCFCTRATYCKKVVLPIEIHNLYMTCSNSVGPTCMNYLLLLNKFQSQIFSKILRRAYSKVISL